MRIVYEIETALEAMREGKAEGEDYLEEADVVEKATRLVRIGFTEAQRDEIAVVLEDVAERRIKGPRDLDVAIEAIEAICRNVD